MISVINYTVRFLFTALFVIINSFLKRCHPLINHFFLKKLLTEETSPLLDHIEGNTSGFGSAIQVLPSDIRKYCSLFLITAVAFVISVYFCYWKSDVNFYVGKLDLTWFPSNMVFLANLAFNFHSGIFSCNHYFLLLNVYIPHAKYEFHCFFTTLDLIWPKFCPKDHTHFTFFGLFPGMQLRLIICVTIQ